MLPGKPTVFVNTKFFDTMTKIKVCSNFGHEYFHTLGARHGGNLFRLSLAYFMNTVIEKLYREMFGEDDPLKPMKMPPAAELDPASKTDEALKELLGCAFLFSFSF